MNPTFFADRFDDFVIICAIVLSCMMPSIERWWSTKNGWIKKFSDRLDRIESKFDNIDHKLDNDKRAIDSIREHICPQLKEKINERKDNNRPQA